MQAVTQAPQLLHSCWLTTTFFWPQPFSLSVSSDSAPAEQVARQPPQPVQFSLTLSLEEVMATAFSMAG